MVLNRKWNSSSLSFSMKSRPNSSSFMVFALRQWGTAEWLGGEEDEEERRRVMRRRAGTSGESGRWMREGARA